MVMSKARGGRWPIFMVLAVLLLGVAFFTTTLEKGGLQKAIDAEVGKVSSFVDGSLSDMLVGVDVSKELNRGKADELTQELSREILSGGTAERLRLFAPDGTLIYSTDGGDKLGTRLGAADAIRAAAGGTPTGIESFDRVGTGEADPQSLRLLTSYVPLKSQGDGTLAVVAVDERYRLIEERAKGPWGTVQIGLLLAAVVMLELGLFGLARNITAKRLAARSGFQPAASKAAPSAKPMVKDEKQVAKAAEQEAKIRQALEDQLETLRTEARLQQEDAVRSAREFTEQLKAAATRAEQAEAKQKQAVTPDPKVEERAREAAQKLEQAEQRALEAEAQVAELDAKLVAVMREADERPEMPDLPEDLAEMAKELHDARQRATEQQRRALEEGQHALVAAEKQQELLGHLDELKAELSTTEGELEETRAEASRGRGRPGKRPAGGAG